MFRYIRSTLSIAMAAIFLAGCAPTNQAANGAADLVGDGEGVIIVDNSNTVFGLATIYLVPENGTREMIGSVDPSGEAEFSVAPDVSLEYQLVAEVGTDEMVSRSFTFTESSALEWDLATNVVLPVSDDR